MIELSPDLLLRAYAAGLAAAYDPDQARYAALTGLFDYYLAGCAAAMDCLAPAERHHRPSALSATAAIPELGDPAAARAWLDAELATLVAVAAYTASNGWSGHTTRLAATIHRFLTYGHDTEGLTICGHALNAARDCGDRAARAHVLTNTGAFHANQSRYQLAADHHHQALTLARDIGDKLVQARALGNLGVVHARQGGYQQATDHLRQAFGLYHELGDQLGEVIQLVNLGHVYLQQGKYEQAATARRTPGRPCRLGWLALGSIDGPVSAGTGCVGVSSSEHAGKGAADEAVSSSRIS